MSVIHACGNLYFKLKINTYKIEINYIIGSSTFYVLSKKKRMAHSAHLLMVVTNLAMKRSVM